MMHMDKLVAMLDTHMRGTISGRAWLDPKEEKLMSNITRSAPILVMPYLGGTFKVLLGEVYLVVDMQQHKCTCLTWQMSVIRLVGLSCITLYFSMPNDALIILTMVGTSMFTRCSAARFKKLCNRLPEAKIQAIRDLQFGGLLNLNCTEVRHNLCIFLIQHFNVGFRRIEFSAQKHYHVTTTDVGLIFDLPMEGRNLRIHLLHMCHIVGPTSRLNGCRNLWHTIHDDGFRNDVNWAQFVLDQLVEGIRRYQQSKTSWLHYVIKFQIPSVQVPITGAPTLIKEFGAFGHVEIDFRTMEPETNVDHDTNVDLENSDEIWHQYHDASEQSTNINGHSAVRIMRGLMHKLGTRRHSGVNSDAGGHSSYAPASTPTADDHAFPGDEYMASHAAYHVLDTPDRVVAPEYELQPSVPINVVSGK
ncbi:hypothetical protein AAG906_006066 [Vitis piasezkii]